MSRRWDKRVGSKFEMKNEDNRTIIVITGASSGLGRDMAISLAKHEGNHLVLTARSEDKLTEVAEIITNMGGSAYTFAADLTEESDVIALSEFLRSKFNRVNVLINNAGLGIFKPLVELSSDEWKLMNDTMVYGTFLCTKYILPLILESTEPRHIIINSSFWGIKGDTPLCTAYIAAKFAQRGLSLSLREELRYHNIKVTCLMPGSINTPFFDFGGGWPHDPNRILSSEELSEVVNDIIHYKGNLVVEEIVVQAVNPD